MLHSNLGISPLLTVLCPYDGIQCEMAQDMYQALHHQGASVLVKRSVVLGLSFCFSVVFQTWF